VKIGAPKAISTRISNAIATGAPTTSAMKMVRRDHSISPTDKSKIRRLDEKNAGGRRTGVSAVVI
jgi:hypothetical protein